MKRQPQCVDCDFAEWKKTATGRLHPSGDGRCLWQYPDVRLPISRYFIGGTPNPYGGAINRKDEWKQCPRYTRRALEQEKGE